MGIIRCNIHGDQSFVEVCEHVGAALRTGSPSCRTRILEVDVCACNRWKYAKRMLPASINNSWRRLRSWTV